MGARMEAKKLRRRRFSWFQAVLIVVLLVMVWYGFGMTVLSPARGMSAPTHLGSLQLSNTVDGAEALKQVNKLHGTDIMLNKALIADYGNGNEHVTVWVGEAADSSAAADLLERMVAGIQTNRSPFKNLRLMTAVGQEVWQVDGPEGPSYFYQTPEPARRVIWVTVQSPEPLPLLENVLNSSYFTQD